MPRIVALAVSCQPASCDEDLPSERPLPFDSGDIISPRSSGSPRTPAAIAPPVSEAASRCCIVVWIQPFAAVSMACCLTT